MRRRVASFEDVTRHPQNDRTRCLGRISSRRHPRPGTGRPEVHPGPEARRGTRRASGPTSDSLPRLVNRRGWPGRPLQAGAARPATTPSGAESTTVEAAPAGRSRGRPSAGSRQQRPRGTSLGSRCQRRFPARTVRAVVRDVELDHHRVVYEPVDRRGRGHLVAEDPILLAEH